MDKSTWSYGPFTFGVLGMRTDGTTDVEDFEEPFELIFGWNKNINWWIGDLFNKGEEIHGENIWNVVPEGWQQDFVEVCMAVAKAVPLEVRRIDLSWECHREVCKLSPEVQRVCLSVAATKGWDHIQLREYAQRWRRNSRTGLSV